MKHIVIGVLIVIASLGWVDRALAESLSDRVVTFPQWQHLPTVQAPDREIAFPQWIAGTWHVKSTLVDLAAPLAPDIVTPGFEGNRASLNQPIEFDVRFVEQSVIKTTGPIPSTANQIVVDRAFNGLNIARAYLGDNFVKSVTVNPKSPNEQRTLLQGDRDLISRITGRNTEQPNSEEFITTELFQQIFRGSSSPYLNQVETTTDYRLQPSAAIPETPTIVADQFTAIYLSPQDPQYFRARETPVALYRYRLELFPVTAK
ncbi:DUF6816 family protein [Alkalinema sp. FACHB-956]|uniref:DUF6816 family protein n=1 Tax=Alkalinema sp. FACHB-956 TaxID=2692768 RepID=UPI001686964D|nr:hypothetical protein [Alkalinema sp. FACHB-956]MBD2327185.1 hypothetical protein [Alkalinema sp. FACHB-956]